MTSAVPAAPALAPNPFAKPRLTRAQVEFFRREGYLKYDMPVFQDAEFAALKTHFEEKLRQLPPEMRPEAMDVPHFTDLALFRWLFSSAVLDLVEPLLGPDIALFSSHFICKPGGHGKRVPWHEDSYYWGYRKTGVTANPMLEPMEVVTLWLAIDPSTTVNGCMKVIPRTQHNGASDYEPVDPNANVFPIEMCHSQIEAARPVALELQPNQASLHEGRLVHGSDANTSPQRRCGYTMRYISTRVKFRQEQHPHHQIYLARGRDHAGNQYADATRVYTELARYREVNKKTGH
jgi:hypothetical protein